MNSFDNVVDPLGSLFTAHRRVERRLAELAVLPVHLELHGMSASCCASAAGIVHTLDRAVAGFAAQEDGLFGTLARRVRSTADERSFSELRQHLSRDHREIEQAWRGLRRPLRAVAEGMARPLDPTAIAAFRALHGAHVAMEEAPLHRLAMRYLGRHDLRRLAADPPPRRVRALVA